MSRCRSRLIVAGFALIALAPTLPAWAVTLFVDDDAPPGGDSANWATAFHDLQDALAVATAGDEIRVAAGVYKPDRSTFDRTVSFELINGVTVYGGYAGSGAPDPDARGVDANETVLSGDLLGDDGPDFLNNRENSRVALQTGCKRLRKKVW